MSAPIDVDHHSVDHCCRWSRTGHDGACLDRCRLSRRGDQRPLSGIDVAAAIGFTPRIVSAGPLNQCQPWPHSVPATPCTTTKSP